MFIFFSFLTRFPLYIVWLVGIVLALMWWRRHPRISMFAVIAFGCQFAATIFQPALGFGGAPWGAGSSWTGSQVGFLVIVGGLFSALLGTAAWVCVLLAIFSGRRAPAAPKDEPAGVAH